MKKWNRKFIKNSTKRLNKKIISLLKRKRVSALYQPIWGITENEGDSFRDSVDRFNSFKKYIDDKEVNNVLDIGCNVGYFSFASGDLGKYVIGVDSDPFSVNVCNAVKHKHEINNVHFDNSLVDDKYLETMPSFDAVIFMSVFHHWVKYYGYDDAMKRFHLLAKKINKYIIFETGQSDEEGTKWKEQLSFMNPDPQEWIKKALKEIGFKEIIDLGQYSTHLSHVKRNLYVAVK